MKISSKRRFHRHNDNSHLLIKVCIYRKCVAIALIFLSSSAMIINAEKLSGNLRRLSGEMHTPHEQEGSEGEGANVSTVDKVSMTRDSAIVREKILKDKKRKGLWRRQASISSILFPGVSPNSFLPNDTIPMFVDLLDSQTTLIPFNYYKLPVCKNRIKEPKQKSINLGQRLLGYKSELLPYKLKSKVDLGCTPVCLVSMSSGPLQWMRRLIKDHYRVHLTIDGLPVAIRSPGLDVIIRGYPLGFISSGSDSSTTDEEIYLFNHLQFTITYYENADLFQGIRITGFDVHPVSIKHDIPHYDEAQQFTDESTLTTCGQSPIVNDPSSYLPLSSGPNGEDLHVLYSYETKFVQSDVEWSDRWDVYMLEVPGEQVHYYGIVNTLMIALLLAGVAATIMLRTLTRDIAEYNEHSFTKSAGAHEETGWKLVHGDVFRYPRRGRLLLSVAVGTGSQIGTSILSTLSFAMLKLLNSQKKGQMLTSILFLYVLSGAIAGYVSSRLYKYFDGKAWKRCVLLTASVFPGVLLALLIFLNCFLTVKGASTAISISTLFAVFLLWVCVCAPLVLLGSYFGFRAQKIEVPTKTNQLSRCIPASTRWPWSAIMGGIVPFASIYLEFYHILNALWLHQIYYIMGFIFAVVIMLTISCSLLSMSLCYIQLCYEDHKWWWNSFFNCATAGFYLFLYSIWYLNDTLSLVGFLPVMVYLTYMAVISVAFGLYCGAVGLLSSFWFCRKIYSAVKFD